MRLLILVYIVLLGTSLSAQIVFDEKNKRDSTYNEEFPLFEGAVVEADENEEIMEVPSEEEILEAEKEINQLFPNREMKINNENKQKILNKYKYVDPTNLVSKDLLEEALVYFDSNAGFMNREYISIVDYSRPSWEKRLFIIRMSDGVVYNRHVGHGKMSDPDHNGYLDEYSNKPNSNKSSKGFYRVSEIYFSSVGKIGRAVKLDGLSKTNSNARRRGVVFHGSDYVLDKNVKQGRSLGCVTVSWNDKDSLLDLLTGGSLLLVNKTKVN